ncbi:MAG: DEAD/DEAH box helicase [Phycisphaerales bacterium]
MNSTETFDTSKKFSDLGLPETVLRALSEKGFEHPTRIQASLLPVALSGKDCLGQAKTGTGKTAAFALPMLSRLDKADAFSGLVLVPTRELAIQVAKEFMEFAKYSGHKVVAVYGGSSINTQTTQLKSGPAIIVGTPGRVMDMNQRGILPYNNVKVAVLDEVDRMLDIGFREDIRRILGSMKQHPQTVFVSATISPEIEKLARSYMRDAEKIVSSEKSLTVSQVDQSYLPVDYWCKRRLLHHLLTHETAELTVVFCRTKRTVDDVTEYLQKKSIDAFAIHGDMYQKARDKVMERLRGGQLSVLVASDLAARGLDVDDISHVINYDIPEDPEVYVHRIGRTARAGRRGIAWSFVCPDQGELLTNIEMLTNVEIVRKEYPDFDPGPPPVEVQARRDQEVKRRETNDATKNRFQAVAPTPTAADPTKFPGGVVPTGQPMKRLGGKVNSRRRH